MLKDYLWKVQITKNISGLYSWEVELPKAGILITSYFNSFIRYRVTRDWEHFALIHGIKNWRYEDE